MLLTPSTLLLLNVMQTDCSILGEKLKKIIIIINKKNMIQMKTVNALLWGPNRTSWTSASFVAEVRVISTRTFHVWQPNVKFPYRWSPCTSVGKCWIFLNSAHWKPCISHKGSNIRLSVSYPPYLLPDFCENRCWRYAQKAALYLRFSWKSAQRRAYFSYSL
jgi:hypothetical protein